MLREAREWFGGVPTWIKVGATIIGLATGAVGKVWNYEREITMLQVENAWLKYQLGGGIGPAPMPSSR